MKQTLGQKLRYLRESRDYTQEQLCHYLHIARTAYANYEKDRRIPSYRLLVALSDFYHISVEYLMRDDYSGCPAIRSEESDRLLLMFDRLEPSCRSEIIEYMIYRLKKQKLKQSKQTKI